MKLSIIVPVYNEEKTILEILNRLKAVQFPCDYEIIIVDDGSQDRTPIILSQLKNFYKIIRLSQNCGKGFAIRKGLELAEGEIIAIQDADLEYNPQDLPKLIQPILEGQKIICANPRINADTASWDADKRRYLRESVPVKIVYGSRFLFKHKPRYKIPYLGNRFLSFLFWFLYGKKINDPWTGYKVFQREVIKNMNFQSKGFEFEMEFTAKILKAGYQILEIPISYQSRTYEEGKKIKIRDGLKAIWTIIKYRFI
jgi:glycosyltransferase involved in cell wall biosynthesis